MPKVLVGKCLLPQLLKERHMSSTDLSELTGISIYQLSKYINNKSHMTMMTAMLIAWALKCQIDDLYNWKVQN